ncbi:LANO_0E04786g1_1 [Lachancea nothofagi CBS 11611]|uniref:Mediator of RNA polymerase II transcription subunit 7 n=1 Tax=Lachancea nothofagi CBS 11611 TaxID=1266666 RepID=A0A1G4JSF9_9SACH|nr:LANO_0E04786g1_1 [Lachancea nothofagi CBS 11611]
MSTSATNEIAALYPSPPPYIKYFSPENVAKVEELKSKGESLSSLGNDLEYLVPPPVPTQGHYRAFGSIWQVKDELPDLESMGMTQLYQPKEIVGGKSSSYQDKIQELHKLLKSLLLNFLELTGILSLDPEQFPKKVEHIQTILVNIHHLLNEYRPHQSRESLIMLLEEQLEYKKREIQNIEQVCQDVREKLKVMISGGEEEAGGRDKEAKEEEKEVNGEEKDTESG